MKIHDQRAARLRELVEKYTQEESDKWGKIFSTDSKQFYLWVSCPITVLPISWLIIWLFKLPITMKYVYDNFLWLWLGGAFLGWCIVMIAQARITTFYIHKKYAGQILKDLLADTSWKTTQEEKDYFEVMSDLGVDAEEMLHDFVGGESVTSLILSDMKEDTWSDPLERLSVRELQRYLNGNAGLQDILDMFGISENTLKATFTRAYRRQAGKYVDLHNKAIASRNKIDEERYLLARKCINKYADEIRKMYETRGKIYV